mgnify:CR=1 FL=1
MTAFFFPAKPLPRLRPLPLALSAAAFLSMPALAQGRYNPPWAALNSHPEGTPDLILRQPMAPLATFRGAVNQGGTWCADIIQVWLDVSHHPARGQEQADHIYSTVLQPIVEQGDA